MKYNTIPLVFLTTSIGGYFQSYSIVHVRRQVNYVAYDLARDARLFFPLRVWGGGCSSKHFKLCCKRLGLVIYFQPVLDCSSKKKKKKVGKLCILTYGLFKISIYSIDKT